MPRWIDSHCHLNYPELSGDLAQTLAAARQEGVQGMLTICTELEQKDTIIAIAELDPYIWSSVGVHPHETEDHPDAEYVYAELIKTTAHPKVVALGETGLDYYYEHSPKDVQKSLFQAHCSAAVETQLPLIVHTRDAEEDTIALLEEYRNRVTGVIHCFTGTETLAKAALDLGFYISISGVVTFKKADELRRIVASIPLERLLLETDAPYLAPEPYRGRSNQPAYMIKTAETVARVKDVSLETLAEHTTRNFFTLFSKATPHV